MKATFGHETVWFNTKGITNILSFSLCEKAGYELDFDKENNQFTMKGKGLDLVFKVTHEGLYACELEEKTQHCGLESKLLESMHSAQLKKTSKSSPRSRLQLQIGQRGSMNPLDSPVYETLRISSL